MRKTEQFSILSLGVAGMMFVLLSACDASIPAAKTTEPVASTSKPAAHAHISKPGAAVKLLDTQPYFFAAPGVGDLELTLSAPSMDGVMQIGVSTGTGIELLSSPTQIEFPLSNTTEHKLPLRIRTTTEGRFYINLQINVAHGDQVESRVLTAIVQVGKSTVNARKGAADNAAGQVEGIIDLPAQETILPAK